ncbi:MAG: VOC family protein [Dehalococcoidia bacterium]|nr:VOC family protein [Dehalococcoidia bacterium]
MPTTFRYHHVHLRSPDPRKTAEFYRDMFGAKIIETPQPSGLPRIDLSINGMAVFIARSDPQTPVGTIDAHNGLDHFGLKVDDLDQAVEELKAKGAEFSTEPRKLPNGVKIAMIRGPQDVRIEIVEWRSREA